MLGFANSSSSYDDTCPSSRKEQIRPRASTRGFAALRLPFGVTMSFAAYRHRTPLRDSCCKIIVSKIWFRLIASTSWLLRFAFFQYEFYECSELRELFGLSGKMGKGESFGKCGKCGKTGKSGKSRICRPRWCIVVGAPPVLRRQSASPQQSSNRFDSAFGSHDW